MASICESTLVFDHRKELGDVDIAESYGGIVNILDTH